MKPIRLLLVEDDAVDRLAFERYVKEEGLPYQCVVATGVDQAKKTIKAEPFDIIVSDYRLGDGTAFDILDLKLDTQIIITTGAGDEEVAVRAMKSGAHDYLIKDPDRRYLQIVPVAVDRALARRKTEEQFRILSEREQEETAIINGAGLSETVRLVDLAASTDSPVFITGETGTGKNLFAKAIHYRSGKRDEPFIGINCAAIPETLIESELFGHEKGAFTGAIAAKKGTFELAEGGTLLLDELGEMPLHLQTKLLGVLDDKRVRRLGSESMRPIDVRVITTTNVEIEKALGKTFRTDLYYRLSVIRIGIPPLRERKNDIPDLCRHLLRKLNNGTDVPIADDEIRKLQNYPWPGNVRELRNILERTLILHRGTDLRPSEFLHADGNQTCLPLAVPGGAPEIPTIEALEETHIRRTLGHFSGNIARTARALGISISTLKRKSKQYGLR